MACKALLIGLDGASFTSLRSLAADGTTPFLAQLLSDGMAAALESIEPDTGLAVWSSLVAGSQAGAGGGETLWSVVHGHGLRSIAVNVPGMTPGLEGVRVAEAPAPAREAGGDAELLRRDEGIYEAFRRLDGDAPAELCALVLDGFGRVERWVKGASRQSECFRRLDALIARCCERVGDGVTVYLVGYGSGEPYGIFVARGPEVRPEEAPPMTLADVAPTVLHGLGLAAPAGMEGRARVSAPAGPALGAREETMIADRLRELGYIE